MRSAPGFTRRPSPPFPPVTELSRTTVTERTRLGPELNCGTSAASLSESSCLLHESRTNIIVMMDLRSLVESDQDTPASSSLTHARRMDGFCNQNADQLGSLAGPSLLTVYVGVVECAPASPYTYSSSTHRFPDERTPIEATPLSATSAELGLGLGLGLGLDSLSHSSSHALPFFSPPSFHTLSLSPAFTSVWW